MEPFGCGEELGEWSICRVLLFQHLYSNFFAPSRGLLGSTISMLVPKRMRSIGSGTNSSASSIDRGESIIFSLWLNAAAIWDIYFVIILGEGERRGAWLVLPWKWRGWGALILGWTGRRLSVEEKIALVRVIKTHVQSWIRVADGSDPSNTLHRSRLITPQRSSDVLLVSYSK